MKVKFKVGTNFHTVEKTYTIEELELSYKDNDELVELLNELLLEWAWDNIHMSMELLNYEK